MALLLAYPELAVALALIVSAAAVLLQHHSSGWISWFQKFVENVPLFAGLFSLEQVIQLDRWVTNKLGHVRESVEHVGVKWLAALSFYVYVMGYWSTYWPVALKNTVEHLIHRTIPRAINARTKPLDRRIDVAEAEAKAAAGRAHSAVTIINRAGTVQKVTKIERVAMPHAREWEWIHKHWKAVTAAVLGAAALPVAVDVPAAPSLPIPFGRTVRQIKRRLRRVEALLGVTAFAAVMARVLRIPSPHCLTRGPIGKVARRLCGLGSEALNDLLSLLVDVVLVADICQVVNMLESGLEIIQGPLDDIVGVVGGSLCHGDYAAPPNVGPFVLSLPAVTGYALT